MGARSLNCCMFVNKYRGKTLARDMIVALLYQYDYLSFLTA